jgi:UDP-sugar transporter A1/2/3
MCKINVSAGTPQQRLRAGRKRSLSLMALVSIMQIIQTSSFVAMQPVVSLMPTRTVHNFLQKGNPSIRARSAPPKPTCTKSISSARYSSLLPVAISSLPTSWFYMLGLSLQFGLQPLLTKAFTPSGIVRSTVIMAQDLARFGICCAMLVLGGSWNISLQGWSLQGALLGAGIPSLLYMVQNYFALIAYQALPPVTFNILNQTKTLSAALCCYLILGRRQSGIQIMSLFLLLLSALVIENIIPLPWTKAEATETVETNTSTETEKEDSKKGRFAAGVVPILIASFISGLGESLGNIVLSNASRLLIHDAFQTFCSTAGAVSQKSLQNLKYNAYVFSMELSAFSILAMTASLVLGSPDGKKLRSSGFFQGWTWKTWIPVFTNAAGGVLVGLVTQQLGAVRKGFALIFGLLLSGVLQSFLLADEGRISFEQVLGGVLASCSVWMHSKFPPS